MISTPGFIFISFLILIMVVIGIITSDEEES